MVAKWISKDAKREWVDVAVDIGNVVAGWANGKKKEINLSAIVQAKLCVLLDGEGRFGSNVQVLHQSPQGECPRDIIMEKEVCFVPSIHIWHWCSLKRAIVIFFLVLLVRFIRCRVIISL